MHIWQINPSFLEAASGRGRNLRSSRFGLSLAYQDGTSGTQILSPDTLIPPISSHFVVADGRDTPFKVFKT